MHNERNPKPNLPWYCIQKVLDSEAPFMTFCKTNILNACIVSTILLDIQCLIPNSIPFKEVPKTAKAIVGFVTNFFIVNCCENNAKTTFIYLIGPFSWYA